MSEDRHILIQGFSQIVYPLGQFLLTIRGVQQPKITSAEKENIYFNIYGPPNNNYPNTYRKMMDWDTAIATDYLFMDTMTLSNNYLGESSDYTFVIDPLGTTFDTEGSDKDLSILIPHDSFYMDHNQDITCTVNVTRTE